MALSPKKMDILPHVNELFKTYDIKVDESSLKLFENNISLKDLKNTDVYNLQGINKKCACQLIFIL